ncbi:MAG: hypothetical protein ABSF75_04555 [Terracidiphilus sp.]
MKRLFGCLTLVLLAASSGLFAQTSSSNFASPSSSMPGASQSTASPVSHGAVNESPAPFSRLALSGGIGLGGINMQAAVNANRYLNIRGVGNYFSYSVNNIKVGGSGSSGSDVSGTLNFAEGGVALDYFPWPNHGFRLSPGVTFYNQNGASATGTMQLGNSITLGSTKYYSEGGANAMSLNANLGLNTHKQAFTMTTGWGNLISRKGGHFSVPFEIGAIFTGAPTLGLNIAGYGCTTQTDDGTSGAGASCVNMATNTTAQSNIAAQITKYQSDLNVLKVYPIFSIGIGYNFKIR